MSESKSEETKAQSAAAGKPDTEGEPVGNEANFEKAAQKLKEARTHKKGAKGSRKKSQKSAQGMIKKGPPGGGRQKAKSTRRTMPK